MLLECLMLLDFSFKRLLMINFSRYLLLLHWRAPSTTSLGPTATPGSSQRSSSPMSFRCQLVFLIKSITGWEKTLGECDCQCFAIFQSVFVLRAAGLQARSFDVEQKKVPFCGKCKVAIRNTKCTKMQQICGLWKIPSRCSEKKNQPRLKFALLCRVETNCSKFTFVPHTY